MLRTIWLSARNDGRLLVKDPVVLLMLLVAPVVIITVAGYSLGTLYGAAARARVLPVVDRDGGDVGAALLAALRAEPSVHVRQLADVDAARRLVARSDGPALALEIPAGTTTAIAAGRSVQLVTYVDPVKRLAADALEVRLGELCRRTVDEARAQAQARLDETQARLRGEVRASAQALQAEREHLRAGVAAAGRRVAAKVRAREEHAWAEVESQLAARRALLDELQVRLRDLRVSAATFDDWLARLRALAGRHAADLPPLPALPALPSDADLAALARPVARPAGLPDAQITTPPSDPTVDPIALPRLGDLEFAPLPGVLGLTEASATPGTAPTANAFDQYVPGFGVTFLLIGMMLGIALTLFDEREWGTPQRLAASGVPAAGLLLGKLCTRFAVGVVQMVVLFAVGRALFGITLGRAPAALLLPTVGISFAAATLGLIVPALATSHDAVMPLGTMTSMAFSAIGGCWWPLDFEPPWMRALARWLPTTWAMQAYNDLMIRRAPWQAALWPLAATVGLGCLYLAIGTAVHLRRGLH